jgi:NitT/TauT family transport system permease protein
LVRRDYGLRPDNSAGFWIPRMALTVVKTDSIECRGAIWLDAVVLFGIAALVIGISQIAAQWRHPMLQAVDINLSAFALPRYAFFSFARGWIAYFFSLVFTILIASWAFYDTHARRYIIPALDILQSIPVLSFLPGMELALVALFPRSNTGLELACVLSIFTGQVWNMAFSYYDSLRGVPADFRMLAKLYNFSWWSRFWRVELPFGAQALLYNSMVSMAGGWFFLSVCESFSLGDKSFRVPGLGSYMQVATDNNNVRAELFGVIAMGVVIVVVDRLVWWPLVVWSRRFKLDDFGGNRAAKGPLQLWLARSHAGMAFAGVAHSLKSRLLPPPKPPSAETSLVETDAPPPRASNRGKVFYFVLVAALAGLVGWGGVRLFLLVVQVKPLDWLAIAGYAGVSFTRVLAAVIIGTLWAVPVGIWIGLNPKLSSRFQPFIQFAASFPAPMLYPWLLALVFMVHGSLQWGSVLLILFGTQWYILFNVAGAAAAIPNDIISCAEILRLKGWARWGKFLIPAVFPGLVTGWLTAAGGAWNATIVSEYVKVGPTLYQATGLGAYIQRMSEAGDFAHLAAATIVMAVVVVGINRTVWRRLQALANDRCRFIT